MKNAGGAIAVREDATPGQPQDLAGGFRALAGRFASGKLTLHDVWLLFVPLALLRLLESLSVRPHDFWWHLRTGQIIVRSGTIPTTDLFTFTRFGAPWVNQGWLMQVVLYLVYGAGGLALILLVHALVITGGYVLTELACLRSSGEARAATLGTLAGAALGMLHWSVRPQGISFLLFGALVWTIETHAARGGRVIWLWPVLFALWANTHGAFAFGITLLGIYVAARVAEELVARRPLSRETRRSLAAGMASVVALALNPSGPTGIVRYLLGFLQSGATQQHNMEFARLTARSLNGLLFFGVVLLLLFTIYRRRLTIPLYRIAALSVFGVLSLYYARAVPWFGMVAAPSLAWALARPARSNDFSRSMSPRATEVATTNALSSSQQPTNETAGGNTGVGSRPRIEWARPIANYFLVGLLGVAALVGLPWLRPYVRVPDLPASYIAEDETPVAGTEALCRLGDGVRMFNDLAYGSYVAWACPAVPVFVDSRFELYPEEMWRDYALIASAGYGWEERLRKYGINTLLVNRENERPLIAAASASGDWQVSYEDRNAVLLRQVLTERE
jgi:hypothetical protein